MIINIPLPGVHSALHVRQGGGQRGKLVRGRVSGRDEQVDPGCYIHYLHYPRQVGVAGCLHAGAEHHGGLDGAGHGHLQLHRRQLLTQVRGELRMICLDLENFGNLASAKILQRAFH